MTEPTDDRPRRRRAPVRPTTAPEETMTTETYTPEIELSADQPSARPQLRLPTVSALRPLSPTPTYIGIGVAAIGFVLLAVAWGAVAGEDNVAFQMPYLISGGLAGLGMIMVGLTIINVAAKRRDAALREQQIQLLASALRELRNEDGSS
jgi:hypothetical protein